MKNKYPSSSETNKQLFSHSVSNACFISFPWFPDFWTPEPNGLAEVVIHQSFIYEALGSNVGLDTS